MTAGAKTLERLVAFDSTSRNSNEPIADWVADYLDRPGIRVERDSIEAPERGGTKVNLVFTAGPEHGPDADPDRDGLTLCGHLDVVPADEPDWTSDPFTLTDRGDRLVGRGACDMKGFVALAVDAMARVDPATLERPLSIVLTYDEEIGLLGARDLVERHADGMLQRVPRRMIVGEPTSLRAVRLHKGHARLRLTVRGTPAHSGYPHLGHNAIEPLGRAIVALSDLRRQLESERVESSEHFPDVPWTALNLATLEAGSAINVVPERAELELGFRVLPGVDTDATLERIRATIADALEGEDWELGDVQAGPPMSLNASSDLYRAVCGLVEQSETVSASYATDAGWLQQAGFDCLLWGPGDIGVAHKPDEWVPKAELDRCADGIERLIDRFCRP